MPNDPPKRRSEHQGGRGELVDRACELVSEAWFGWADDAGRPYPIPDDWTETVRVFVLLGLAPLALVRSVDTAMRSNAKDPWRYWCGIGWRQVREREKGK